MIFLFGVSGVVDLRNERLVLSSLQIACFGWQSRIFLPRLAHMGNETRIVCYVEDSVGRGDLGLMQVLLRSNVSATTTSTGAGIGWPFMYRE